jgi:cobalt transporter subunit CbtB
MTDQTISIEKQSASLEHSRLAAAAFALAFGAFLVFGAAFAQSTTLHNATHDVRHAFSFPCH